MDGVLVVNDLLDNAKISKKKFFALKVDFEKAYYSFLKYMLMRLGFNDVRRRWMIGCYSANSISVLVNGIPTSEFQARWGLKQGDPLAPLLFIITADGLAGLIRKAE